MNWYISVLRNYSTCKGRATRAEYWYFHLVNTIIAIMLALLDYVLETSWQDIGLISLAYGLIVMTPQYAVAVRRLHDTGRSGWWNLILFIPVIGMIVLLVFWCQASQPGVNKYGPNPYKA